MMKKNVITAMVLLCAVLVIPACNQDKSAKRADKEMEQLKDDLKDAGESARAVAEAEREKALAAADELIREFEKKLQQYEEVVAEKNAQIDAGTREAIDRMKAEKQALEKEFDRMKTASEEQWQEWKSEFSHDMEELEESVKKFFSDDV